MESKTKILVLFYSLTGHTAQLARQVAEGARQAPDTEVVIKQVPELLPTEFFVTHQELAQAKQAFADIPEATVDDLIQADGIAFGSPVHFGSFCSQIKQFIDQLSPIYTKRSLTDKPAAFFVSCGSLHGGEEAALLSLMVPLLNLGMLPLGVPYPIQGEGPQFDAGSPYGAIYTTGHKGELPLSHGDNEIAQILGKRLATIAKALKHGTLEDNSHSA